MISVMQIEDIKINKPINIKSKLRAKNKKQNQTKQRSGTAKILIFSNSDLMDSGRNLLEAVSKTPDGVLVGSLSNYRS